jgi:hypothetical protein
VLVIDKTASSAHLPLVALTARAEPFVHLLKDGAPWYLAEGSSGVYSVQLTAEPVDNVTLYAYGVDGLVSVRNGPFVFTPHDWAMLRQLELEAVDDHVLLPSPYEGRVALEGTSSDARFSFASILFSVVLSDTDIGKRQTTKEGRAGHVGVSSAPTHSGTVACLAHLLASSSRPPLARLLMIGSGNCDSSDDRLSISCGFAGRPLGSLRSSLDQSPHQHGHRVLFPSRHPSVGGGTHLVGFHPEQLGCTSSNPNHACG